MNQNNKPYPEDILENTLKDALYMLNTYGQGEHLQYLMDRILDNGNYIVEEIGETARYNGRTKSIVEKKHMRISEIGEDKIYIIFKLDNDELVYKVASQDEMFNAMLDSEIY